MEYSTFLRILLRILPEKVSLFCIFMVAMRLEMNDGDKWDEQE